MSSSPRALTAVALAILLTGASGCSMMQRRQPASSSAYPQTDMQPVGQLTSRRTGDHERALRMGRDVLREQGLLEKYDIHSATAYEKSDHWEVCFTPKKGPAKRLRRKSFVFPF